jgi:hypothetical protein
MSFLPVIEVSGQKIATVVSKDPTSARFIDWQAYDDDHNRNSQCF